MERTKSVKSLLNSAIEHFARARLQRYLLTQSDRTLEDVGLSRNLLEQGVDAWPWHATPELDHGLAYGQATVRFDTAKVTATNQAIVQQYVQAA